MKHQVKELTDIVGKCERIKKTPIPYSYSIFLKKFIFIYTLTLPLGLATTFFFWSVPISMFVLYILASLELLAEEIENPFGEDTNDLPVDEICNTIKANVHEIFKSLGQSHIFRPQLAKRLQETTIDILLWLAVIPR